MKRYYNVTGEDRKRLVNIIGEVVGERPYYLRVPTCAYEIKAITVTKEGAMIWDGRTDNSILQAVIKKLREAGFVAEEDADERSQADEHNTPDHPVTAESEGTPAQLHRKTTSTETYDEIHEGEEELENLCTDNEKSVTDTTGLTISFPAEGITELQIINMRKIIKSKASLIRKSLGADRLDVEVKDGQISFPWWDTLPEIASPADCLPITVYTEFLYGLLGMAREAKRAVGIERPTESEKYSMRVFLIRLGFGGAEHKLLRKELLKNLTGHSAFRNQEEADKFYTKRKAMRFMTEESMETMEGNSKEKSAAAEAAETETREAAAAE